jgi:hypothetical protein
MNSGKKRQRGSVAARGAVVLALLAASLHNGSRSNGDGMVIPLQEYRGSVAEKAQEAIIIFEPGDERRSAREDLILKIQVEGPVREFAWIVTFPGVPRFDREDPALFQELFRYVQLRLSAGARAARDHTAGAVKSAEPASSVAPPVDVIERRVVGSFEVATVRENQPGALNDWLRENRYRTLDDENALRLIADYREKGYVFACIRVSDVEQAIGGPTVLHPLRFSFETGGRDGIYFPMRLTGLQNQPFDVNLYVFYGKWLNDRLNRFGFTHRGFQLLWRDFDSPECTPNAGKLWESPANDPYLRPFADGVPTLSRLIRSLHPSRRYYLTNLAARELDPGAVRAWLDDLWLFPYYTDARVEPYDAREGGPARAAYAATSALHTSNSAGAASLPPALPWQVWLLCASVTAAIAVGMATHLWRRNLRNDEPTAPPAGSR